MGQKNCRLKPELVQELVHKTYCKLTLCIHFVSAVDNDIHTDSQL